MSEEHTQPRDDADSALADERRVRVRHYQKLSTYAQRGTGDLDQLWWMGRVRNISESGIGVILQNRFEPGTRLTFELENASQSGSHTFQAEVVRVFPEQGGWFTGCTFLRELTQSELQGLLK